MQTSRRIAFILALLGAALATSSAWAQDAPPADPPPAEEPAEGPAEPPPAEEPPPATESATQAEPPGVEEEAEPMGDESGTVHERGGLFGAGVVIGLKAGGGFHQLLSPLGATFVGELELGYNFPFHDRNLGLFVSGQYSMPGASESVTESDPRLPGDGTWSYDISTMQAILTYGLIYRIPIPTDILRPYIAAGGRTYFVKTTAEGSSNGEPFGTNEETGTFFGAYGALGADFFLGPGSLLFEVQFAYGPLDATIIRNSNSGSLNVALGYRFFL